MGEEDDNEINGDSSRDLRNDDDEINDPVEERLTLAERNERLQNQLKSLKDELSVTRMILVKLLWIVFTKKMLSKGEINTRPCVKFVKAIPNDVWINSKICKRLFLCV